MKKPWDIYAYDYHGVCIETNEDYIANEASEFSEYVLNVTPQVQVHKSNPDRWRLSLDIVCKPLEGAVTPYKSISVKVVGVFDFTDLCENSQRLPLLSINGSSILYSSAREYILGVTSRCCYGPFSLPTWNPREVLSSNEKVKKDDPCEP